MKNSLFLVGLAFLSLVLTLEAVDIETITAVYNQPYGSKKSYIEGEDAVTGQFPYQAGILINYAKYCGGSLISKDWVLTAAHCVQMPSLFVITLGALRLQAGEPGSQVISSTIGIRHEEYEKFGLMNDIALIRLPQSVRLTETVSPIPLPPRSFQYENFVGETVQASGWSRVRVESSFSIHLKYVNLDVISPKECTAIYGEDVITNTKICCVGQNNQNPCQGGSGGPLTIGRGENKTLLGIISFGARKGCSQGLPTGYTATAFYLDWIAGKTGITVRDL